MKSQQSKKKKKKNIWIQKFFLPLSQEDLKLFGIREHISRGYIPHPKISGSY